MLLSVYAGFVTSFAQDSRMQPVIFGAARASGHHIYLSGIIFKVSASLVHCIRVGVSKWTVLTRVAESMSALPSVGKDLTIHRLDSPGVLTVRRSWKYNAHAPSLPFNSTYPPQKERFLLEAGLRRRGCQSAMTNKNVTLTGSPTLTGSTLRLTASGTLISAQRGQMEASALR
jgi:hypothetical protein